MARITRDEVQRIAALARLELADAEAERITGQLEAVLGHVEQLAELDTEGVEPTAHAIPVATPLRPDVAGPVLDPEVALGNAPAREGTAFLVPKVIEEG